MAQLQLDAKCACELPNELTYVERIGFRTGESIDLTLRKETESSSSEVFGRRGVRELFSKLVRV